VRCLGWLVELTNGTPNGGKGVENEQDDHRLQRGVAKADKHRSTKGGRCTKATGPFHHVRKAKDTERGTRQSKNTHT
jgi:hypothetical protein